ncbi:MAG TPA: hypothetical protein VFZ00_01520 [Solirubrobacter sp.]|nr:hypothetical protein [Solirubrobacter sp.]
MSSLAYARWARELRMADWGLKRTHGVVLRLMVDYADQHGQCTVSVKTLATTLELTREYVHKLQRELAAKGLARKVRPGGGARPAVWRLCIDARPPAQLQLGDLQAATVNVNSDCERELENVESVNSGVHKKGWKEGVGGDAHEQFTVSGGGGEAPETPGADVLAPTLDQVLAVLRSAPGVDVEPLSINAILLGHPEPEHDHHRGAQTVAAWAHEGGLWARSGSRLLQRALLKQTETGRQLANRIPPPGRRQRPGAPRAAKPWDGALAAARHATGGAA